jgi:DNA repair protein RecO (recombination protein O)
MYLKTNGIVLKRTKLSENDVLVTILTYKAGLVKAVIKGAKNPKSPLSAASHPFVFGEFVIRVDSKWSKVQSAEIIDSFYKVREDLEVLSYGSYFMELAIHILEDGVVNHKMYYLLLETINTLVKTKPDDIKLLKVAYEIKLLEIAGYSMMVEKCSECGCDNTGFVDFLVSSGGVLCPNCKSSEKKPIIVGKTIPKIIDYMKRKDIRVICQTQINVSYLEKMDILNKRYLSEHLGFNHSKSLEFINTMKSI